MFLHGADASRYYTSALSLSNGNGFGDLLYTVPVYPFFLSIHYKILGFHYGNESPKPLPLDKLSAEV